MDFKELESFVAIARAHSFKRAAERLFLTQPALSNHIARLEKELGVTLFDRNNKKIELTDAGKKFYPAALEILAQRENALLSLQQYKGNIEGHIYIATSSVSGQLVLSHILADFFKIYPDVTYNHSYLSTGEIVDSLISCELDFGFVDGPPKGKGLIWKKIAEDPMVVITPDVEPFTSMASISFDTLLDYPLLIRTGDFSIREQFDIALKTSRSHKTPRIVANIHNNKMIMLCVKAGLGLSVAFTMSAEDEMREGQIKKLPFADYECQNALYFVYPKNRSLSPLSQRFKEFVANARGFQV
mgnify:FL=1